MGNISPLGTTIETKLKKSKELTIAGAFEETKNLKDLSQLLREGKMKEFY